MNLRETIKMSFHNYSSCWSSSNEIWWEIGGRFIIIPSVMVIVVLKFSSAAPFRREAGHI